VHGAHDQNDLSPSALRRTVVRKWQVQLRRFTLTTFAALQHTYNLKDAQTLYRNIYIVLNSKRPTDAVDAAKQRIVEVSLDDDNNAVPNNTSYSPPCFRAIKAIICLHPLWSTVFQNDVKRFSGNICTVRKYTDVEFASNTSNASINISFHKYTGIKFASYTSNTSVNISCHLPG